MALNIRQAKKNVDREYTVKSGIEGFPDRVFIFSPRAEWIDIREKGKPKYRRIKIQDFFRWVYTHCQEIDPR